MRSPIFTDSLQRGIEKLVFRLACCCLSFGLLTLMAGCSKTPRSAEHVEVSGKVLLQGKPLPGGRVMFVTVKGGFASSATIDENGNYQIKAPVGDVEIGVDNQMLANRRGPKQTPHPKKPDAEAAGANQPVKGRWVKLPNRYADPHTSGLKYTVTPGSQTHNIELSDTPDPPVGNPGS